MEPSNRKQWLEDYGAAAKRLDRSFRREAREFYAFFLAVHPRPLWKGRCRLCSPLREEWLMYEEALLCYMEEAFAAAYSLGQMELLHTDQRAKLLTRPIAAGRRSEVPPREPGDIPPIPPEFCRDEEE